MKEFNTDNFGKSEKSYPYFAIVPQNGKSYNITVNDDYQNFFAYSKRWLVINVAPVNPDEDLSYKNKATVIKLEDVYAANPDEKFNDNIKVINHTSDKNISVRIYGFNDEYDDLIKPIKKIKEQVYGAGDNGADKVNESQRIWIYGLNVDSDAWNPIALAVTTSDEVEPNFHPKGMFKGWTGPSIYKNFALVFEGGKSYKVNAHAEHNDLYIELTD